MCNVTQRGRSSGRASALSVEFINTSSSLHRFVHIGQIRTAAGSVGFYGQWPGTGHLMNCPSVPEEHDMAPQMPQQRAEEVRRVYGLEAVPFL